MMPVSIATAEHYLWGDSFDGWHLVNRADLSVIQERVPPGSVEVRHKHARARQFIFVVSGVATFEVGGVVHTLGTQQGIEVPPDTPHQFRNLSSDDVTFLVVSSPHSHDDRIVVNNIDGI
jgi:mannose-6-phosphate isomerase-like protein (cupin superfamily)